MRFDLASGEFIECGAAADAPAVIGSDRSLSWTEFRRAVDDWVTRAEGVGVGPDVPVVLHGHKEAEFVVAMAGCLALGAPFVPVDEIYPEERLLRITSIVRAPVIYSSSQSVFRKTEHAPVSVGEKRLAYVMFTSGSTGEPKGVQIGREGIVALTSWMRDCFNLGPSPVFMNQAPFSFDLSMYELFGFMASGGCIVLNSRQLLADGRAFLSRLHEHGVTVWVSTPSFAHQQLLDRNFEAAVLPTLRVFLFCGEILPSKLVRRLRERFPAAQVLNTYGPTEATVATTWIIVDDAILSAYDPLPVGRAKPGSIVRIEAGSGEIEILGEHVMRGYLNRPELNQEKLFMEEGMRGFRTGDTGELRDEGLLFCHGRRDEQIKLNGYRIELQEIDLALQHLPGVTRSAVVPLRKPDGSVARLVAYLVMEHARDTEIEGQIAYWRDQLARKLPSYMLPSEFLPVAELPMSTNGKIDRKALERSYQARSGVSS